MTKHLILARHSVPEIRGDRPASTWRLSAEGRLRALRLAEELEQFQPEVILSSREPRAHETAEIVAGRLRLTVQVLQGAQEHDRSGVPYLPPDVFQASLRDFFQKPDQLVFGGETANEAHARFYRAVHAALNEHSDKTVVILTHGTVIALFVSRLTGSAGLDLWSRLGLPSFVALDLHSSTVVVRSTIF